MYIDDRVLKRIEAGYDYCFEVYEQQTLEIVLGRSREPERDVCIERASSDGIPVLRRLGGGGTVLLAPGVIVLSAAGKTSLSFHLREHMNAVNGAVICALESLGVHSLSIRGISDIAIDDRKILGSSLYRRKDIVLYQGSLLLNPDFSKIDAYLTHPDREPDYRMGRGHREFLTSLWKEGYGFSSNEVLAALKCALGQKSPWSALEETAT